MCASELSCHKKAKLSAECLDMSHEIFKWKIILAICVFYVQI